MPEVPTQAMISQHSPTEVGEPLFRQLEESYLLQDGDGSEQLCVMHGSSAEENGPPASCPSERLSDHSHHSHLSEVWLA
jgi:hypothetical protein